VFVIASNAGIYFLLINKETLAMSLSKEIYLKNKPVNKVLLRGSFIIATVHDSEKFYVINRAKKEVSLEQKWPFGSLCCTGIAFAPGYHPEEMSIIFVRDQNGIRIINTQTWHISTLMTYEEGEKFIDLKLMVIENSNDHETTFFTME
jgi:hypothetical protein